MRSVVRFLVLACALSLTACGLFREERPTTIPVEATAASRPLVAPWATTPSPATPLAEEGRLHDFRHRLTHYRRHHADFFLRDAVFHYLDMRYFHVDQARTRILPRGRRPARCPEVDAYGDEVYDDASVRGSDGQLRQHWCLTWANYERLQEVDEEIEMALRLRGSGYCHDEENWYAFFNLPTRQEEQELGIECFASEGVRIFNIIPDTGWVSDLQRMSHYRRELAIGRRADFPTFPPIPDLPAGP